MTSYRTAKATLASQTWLAFLACGLVICLAWSIYQYAGAMLRDKPLPSLANLTLIAALVLAAFMFTTLRHTRTSLKSWLRCRQLWRQRAWWELFGFSCWLTLLGMLIASCGAYASWFQLPLADAAWLTLAYAALGGMAGFVGGLSAHIQVRTDFGRSTA